MSCYAGSAGEMLTHRNRRWCRDTLGDPALCREELWQRLILPKGDLDSHWFSIGPRPVSADVASWR
jgi:hypothetical protein